MVWSSGQVSLQLCGLISASLEVLDVKKYNQAQFITKKSEKDQIL